MKTHFSICLLLITLTGCATGPKPTAEPVPQRLEPGIYATETCEKLGEDELFDRLARHRFVVVGERHDDKWHPRIQARTLEAMAERSEEVALGMEMFQRPFQPSLDAYVAGEIDEAEMLQKTEYDSRWGFEKDLYRPLWRLAREQGFPIVALNARRELSRKISQVGLEGLSDEERADIPELDLEHEAHRAYVRQAFEQHDMQMSHERFDRFYSAQVLWDETMADTSVEFVRAHPQVDTMVIVAGGAHAHRGFGIPPRIERRLDTDVVTLQPVSDPKEATMEQLSEATDYVWVGQP